MDITFGEQFLISFFKANGKNPHWAKALEHFKLAFVEPPRFERLLADLSPEEDKLKVVIVDGHPRSGKTWTVVRALETIINNLSLKPNEWWTAGIDSLGVLPTDTDNLYVGARRVEEQLQQHSNYKIVLLDDFLGTNQLRPLGESVSDQSLKPFLSWNVENPWLRNISTGSVLVLTGRSLHFMLVDILLNLKTRGYISEGNGLTVINARRGLFRTVDKGEPFGAFDKGTLRKVCQKNRQYHPLRDEDPDWLIVATPLLAFNDCLKYLEHEQIHNLTEEQRELAASGLFGEDVDSMAEMILSVEAVNDRESFLWREQVLSQLYKAYLVVIAPGLLFLNYTAYEQLGLDDEIKDIVVKGLYLNETIDEFVSERLPNEFYMIAIKDHFNKYIDLAARAFARVVNPTDGEIQDAKGIPGLGIRGLLERGLYGKQNGSLNKLLAVNEFRYLIDTYLKHKNDCLIHLESTHSPSNMNCGVQMSPGLAAAIGWALENFFDPAEVKVKQTVTEWFPARFKFLLEELSNTFKTWDTNPIMSDDVRDQKILPDYYNSKWRVTATYSAFLQWVIRMDINPEKEGLLDQIIKLSEEMPDIIQGELRLIVDDELIWAFGDCEYSPGNLSPVEAFLTFLKQGGKETESKPMQLTVDKRLQVNRLFSLAWHNRWMERSESDFTSKASHWIEQHKESALDHLKKELNLIDDNLQYHWFHFITQRAVWMRDWCFQEDPIQFERDYSQISEGSRVGAHNELLKTIAYTIFNSEDIRGERIRNLLMLLGTRATRITSFEVITGRIDSLIDSEHKHSKEVLESVLQAIFELARQGFLEDSSKNTTAQFRSWCKDKVKTYGENIESAWKPYWDGLSAMTHLDLLPRQEGGWLDVLPKHWYQLELLKG